MYVLVIGLNTYPLLTANPPNDSQLFSSKDIKVGMQRFTLLLRSNSNSTELYNKFNRNDEYASYHTKSNTISPSSTTPPLPVASPMETSKTLPHSTQTKASSDQAVPSSANELSPREETEKDNTSVEKETVPMDTQPTTPLKLT